MEWVSGSIFIRPMGGLEGLAPGQVVTGHTHNFDHTSVFYNGAWRATKWRKVNEDDWLQTAHIERAGPFHLLIEAGCKHEFMFLGAADGMPGRAWCIYSHRTPQGDVSVAATGWEEAYR